MRIIFFGSSEFSLPLLEFCLSSGHEMAAVVTTPDRPQGRGLHLQSNPVKARSQELGILTFSPSSLRDPELEKKILSLNPDLFVVASYGKMIPGSWLRLPRKLALNIHPSLLPKYRGAAPIPRQILEGEKETGVTIAEVTDELDAGDVFCQLRVPLEGKETTKSLTHDLALLGVKALQTVLTQIERETLTRIPQDPSGATYAKKLLKEEGKLNLKEPADFLERKIRAFDPWPGAFIGYQGKPLRILEGNCDSIDCSEAEPATLLETNPQGYLRVQTGKGSLRIYKVQLPGRQVITGREFANGQRLGAGFVFENLP